MHSLYHRFLPNVFLLYECLFCMCVYTSHACPVPAEVRRVCVVPRKSILQLAKPPSARWERSPSPLRAQRVLSTAEPTLQAPNTTTSTGNPHEILFPPVVFLCCLQRLCVFCSRSTSQSVGHMSGLHNHGMPVGTTMKSGQTATRPRGKRSSSDLYPRSQEGMT